MSHTLVSRVSRLVDRHASRRGFLRSSAMAATAMAVAPVAYALRPTTAEAAIVSCFGHRCHSRALCCDGWTEFCCRLTGENTCPPGTVVAGWWKVDDSDFCSIDEPRPRYYIDCNLACEPGCRCGWGGTCARRCTAARCRCPEGCDTRRTECLRFRYGQCNQDVCVGAISCRVVTCVPPWQWDEACSTAPVLRSEATRWHDRPCLHEDFNDIAPKAYYAAAVKWMADEGIAEGLTPDLFGPDEKVSRAQFATFLWRYAGEPAPTTLHRPDDVPASLHFDDVPVGAYYEQAVAWMAQEGLTAGRAPREFGPHAQVSKAQAVVFLYRFAGSPPRPAQPSAVPSELRGKSLEGIGESAWYGEALYWAVSRDIVVWNPDAAFESDLPATRAEVASLLHRFHLSRTKAAADAPVPEAAPDADGSGGSAGAVGGAGAVGAAGTVGSAGAVGSVGTAGGAGTVGGAQR